MIGLWVLVAVACCSISKLEATFLFAQETLRMPTRTDTDPSDLIWKIWSPVCFREAVLLDDTLPGNPPHPSTEVPPSRWVCLKSSWKWWQWWYLVPVHHKIHKIHNCQTLWWGHACRHRSRLPNWLAHQVIWKTGGRRDCHCASQESQWLCSFLRVCFGVYHWWNAKVEYTIRYIHISPMRAMFVFWDQSSLSFLVGCLTNLFMWHFCILRRLEPPEDFGRWSWCRCLSRAPFTSCWTCEEFCLVFEDLSISPHFPCVFHFFSIFFHIFAIFCIFLHVSPCSPTFPWAPSAPSRASVLAVPRTSTPPWMTTERACGSPPSKCTSMAPWSDELWTAIAVVQL